MRKCAPIVEVSAHQWGLYHIGKRAVNDANQGEIDGYTTCRWARAT